MTKRVKGFTLIELLVVIVIIGILATLATVTLSSARAKARDARRVSDVKQVQTALELYYNDAGGYPLTSSATIMTNNVAIVYGTTTYMAKIPSNPTPMNDGSCSTTAYPNYLYTAVNANGTTNTASSYYISYCLGATTGNITAGSHNATPSSIQDP